MKKELGSKKRILYFKDLEDIIKTQEDFNEPIKDSQKN
jgi:hypothetical protein